MSTGWIRKGHNVVSALESAKQTGGHIQGSAWVGDDAAQIK